MDNIAIVIKDNNWKGSAIACFELFHNVGLTWGYVFKIEAYNYNSVFEWNKLSRTTNRWEQFYTEWQKIMVEFVFLVNILDHILYTQ